MARSEGEEHPGSEMEGDGYNITAGISGKDEAFYKLGGILLSLFKA
ncbi:hypothetical protein JN403_04310 [Pseudomonas sp. 15A4]|jgi:hypothetical protein|nr:hypothetical protein [Pseudomonas sp. 15A4]QSB20234.1 hypothetical protein JN403_04310 [Pseudomonas sp. 15A4]